MAFKSTDEQLEALRLFLTGESLAIEAGAGTGKTTTLKLLAESEPNRRGQYAAFNRAIVDESKAKFPATVSCKTAHGLAFRECGTRFSHRLKSPRMQSLEIANRLGINEPLNVTIFDDTKNQLSRAFLAGHVMRALTRFCQSADPEPAPHHVPFIEGLDSPKIPAGSPRGFRLTNTPVNNAVAREMIQYVQAAWRDWSTPDGSLPYKHDAYLKLYQLSDPHIRGIQYFLFDEAQDANPVMVDIVASQQKHGTQVVWVGDSQQQIYGFTGAINALQKIETTHRTFLTQSFRFGPAIAATANLVLNELGADLRLTGTPTIRSEVGTVTQPHAILARTNAEAVRVVMAAQEDGYRPHLVGGGGDVLAFARAAERLMRGDRVEHPELACFDSWAEVLRYVAEDEQGDDLRLNVRLVEEFGVAAIANALDRMPQERDANLIVSTAHKSKGREWATVRLASDFASEPSVDEKRLLYVAVTRAKNRLDISQVGYLTDLAKNGPLPTADAGTAPEPPEPVAGPQIASDAPAEASLLDAPVALVREALAHLTGNGSVGEYMIDVTAALDVLVEVQAMLEPLAERRQQV